MGDIYDNITQLGEMYLQQILLRQRVYHLPSTLPIAIAITPQITALSICQGREETEINDH